jgi:hypothetical protein
MVPWAFSLSRASQHRWIIGAGGSGTFSGLEWIENRRAHRLGLFASGAFPLLLLAGGLVIVPVSGAPAVLAWLGFLVIGVAGVLFLLQLQPSRIGVSNQTITIRWPLRRRNVPLSTVEEYRFLADRRYLNQEWTRRYHSLQIYLTGLHRLLVGGLDGPVARRLMACVPRSRARLMVYAGNRFVEEVDLESQLG